jgi:predicted metal-dependent hydrolase
MIVPMMPSFLRLVPELPLPSYSYVPGGPFPHPGARSASGQQFDLEHWQECRGYLYGIDLFNHGYYWEAHEAWEQLWHACGRKGITAGFLKGLIKLAAAGIKVREGKAQGVRNHARRAAALFQVTTRDTGMSRYLGLDLDDLIDAARRVADQPPEDKGSRDDAVRIVFAWKLRPK